MSANVTQPTTLPEAQLGPAERLLDLVLNASAHLWHNRPGLDVGGVWHPRKGAKKKLGGAPVEPGLFVPSAAVLYGKLLDIYLLNSTLFAHFASYALKETEWRDLKVACAALLLCQTRAGQPIKDEGGAVAFHEDDLRAVGEAMLLFYDRKSTRMMTPKGVLRVAELLETPAIAELNRAAGFGDPAAKGAPLGRWPKAATQWLRLREANPQMLLGLVKAGYKETIKNLARKIGYKPDTQAFFEILGWKQKQSKGGHRGVGLDDLKLDKRGRFDDLSEAEICETIVTQRLSFKEVVGRLPKDVGLTPAIMAALLPSLSDRDLRVMTPTLEELGLMADPEIRVRWEAAIEASTDQRSLHVAKNVKSAALRDKLEEAADHAVKKAASEASADDVHVMFLIDKSGSMEGAIEQSKEALGRILAGFALERVHVACFDTMGDGAPAQGRVSRRGPAHARGHQGRRRDDPRRGGASAVGFGRPHPVRTPAARGRGRRRSRRGRDRARRGVHRVWLRPGCPGHARQRLRGARPDHPRLRSRARRRARGDLHRAVRRPVPGAPGHPRAAGHARGVGWGGAERPLGSRR